jgi:hypothetical protein
MNDILNYCFTNPIDIIYSDEYAERLFSLNRVTSVKIESFSGNKATISGTNVLLNNLIKSVSQTVNA